MSRIALGLLAAALAWAQLACTGDDGAPSPQTSPVGVTEAARTPGPEVAGDPLLVRARASIVAGAVDAELSAEIAASEAPAHARARRLLSAMAQPVDAMPPPAPTGDAPLLRAPPLATAPVDPVSPVSPAAAARETGPAVPRSPTAPSPAAPVVRVVSSLAMKTTKAGATLTIRGRGKLVVGSANQLSSGRVHLMVDKAQASGGVTSARPRAGGVQVTAVRQGQAVLQISLQLDPGWALGTIRAFAGGTRVTFVRA